MDRRTFVKGAAAGAGLAAAGGRIAAAAGIGGPVNIALPSLGRLLPAPRTPVEHVVVVMMENRSVDHYLGWYGEENQAFDGRRRATFPDLRQGPDGPPVDTQDWGTHGLANFHGRGYADPNHGWGGGRAELRGGRCDGWLDPATGNDELALATYGPDDLPAWSQLTRNWQAYDRWFCSLLGPTFPNRYYQHSAQSGGLKSNDLPPQAAADNPAWAAGWDWPTIWTLLFRAGVTGASYFSNLPALALWGARHVGHIRHVANFFADCAAGTLPQVSFVDPWFLVPNGVANDDHPHADIRLGQAFLSDVVEAFTSSSCYRRGALVVTYDEWGGFWDHVRPPALADDRATPLDPGGADDFGQLGFRIPSTVVSPWTRGTGVDHTTYDHTSVLRFISENWDLPYLTARHRSTNSLGRAFRGFATYDPEVPFVPYRAPAELLLEPTMEDAGLGQVHSDLWDLAGTGWFDALPISLDVRFEDGFLRPADILGALGGSLGL